MGVKNQLALSSITLTFSLKQHSMYFPMWQLQGIRGLPLLWIKDHFRFGGKSSDVCDLPANRTHLSYKLERWSHPNHHTNGAVINNIAQGHPKPGRMNYKQPKFILAQTVPFDSVFTLITQGLPQVSKTGCRVTSLFIIPLDRSTLL